MIPKIIHYCWYGGKPLPEAYQAFVDGWQKVMPDYTIMRWDESNSPMDMPYMKRALQNRKWANLSNYVRLHAVHQHGGIYLDTDVETVQPFDKLLNNKCFFGFQLANEFNVNNAIFGAVPGHPFIGKLKDAVPFLYDGKETEYLSSPHITTYLLQQEGLTAQNNFNNGQVVIYPYQYFYPYSWREEFSKDCIQSDTYAIHYWSGSWSASKQKQPPSLWQKVKKTIAPK